MFVSAMGDTAQIFHGWKKQCYFKTQILSTFLFSLSIVSVGTFFKSNHIFFSLDCTNSIHAHPIHADRNQILQSGIH